MKKYINLTHTPSCTQTYICTYACTHMCIPAHTCMYTYTQIWIIIIVIFENIHVKMLAGTKILLGMDTLAFLIYKIISFIYLVAFRHYKYMYIYFDNKNGRIIYIIIYIFIYIYIYMFIYIFQAVRRAVMF